MSFDTVPLPIAEVRRSAKEHQRGRQADDASRRLHWAGVTQAIAELSSPAIGHQSGVGRH